MSWTLTLRSYCTKNPFITHYNGPYSPNVGFKNHSTPCYEAQGWLRMFNYKMCRTWIPSIKDEFQFTIGQREKNFRDLLEPALSIMVFSVSAKKSQNSDIKRLPILKQIINWKDLPLSRSFGTSAALLGQKGIAFLQLMPISVDSELLRGGEADCCPPEVASWVPTAGDHGS